MEPFDNLKSTSLHTTNTKGPSIHQDESSPKSPGNIISHYATITKRIIPLDALVKKPEEEEDDDNNHSQIIQWLNVKQKASTVFVSFGTECYLTKKEFQEIALGLEMSNVNFIWVVRTPNGEKTSELLPKGYLDRVKERGLIFERWAPQAKILKHENIGGFVSHCGWGSLLESMSLGVPIIAVPMQYDQPINARLVVEIGVGFEVVKGNDRKLNGAEVARIIKEVVVEDAGEGIRRTAKELAGPGK
ncbi:hypothetical protein Leryth_023943 [Lithospermum erythrorhizon]|nr:hypothetical protein Leryth_023943 [Lithospermum erythrorhizon]